MSFFVDLNSLGLKSLFENEKNLIHTRKRLRDVRGKSFKEILKIKRRFEKTPPFYLVKRVRRA
jgi:hypothetical protein